MDELTPEGRQFVADLGQRYGFSEEAVTVMLRALAAGGTSMAQFNHWELGGMGQWSPGMLMIGDMFNNGLKGRVDGLASELAAKMREVALLRPAPQPSYQGQSGSFQNQSYQSQSQGGGGYGASLYVQGGGSGGWWPQELGQPSSSGAQNDMRYALFPQVRRLAVQVGGQTTVYDTGDHQIGGFGQQQGGGASITLTSQLGLVRLSDLPVVSGGPAASPPPHPAAPEPQAVPSAAPREQVPFQPAPAEPVVASRLPMTSAAAPESSEDPLARLERLAALRERGLLSEDEFATAKAQLLKRL